MSFLEELRIDTKKLDKLISESKKRYSVKVGVLAGKDARKEDNSNATIGLKHEFGSMSEGIPARSFLVKPLSEKLRNKKRMERILGKAIINSDLKTAAKEMGILSLKIIDAAFRTNGYGKWPPLSEARVKQKEKGGLSENILIATGQLRRSITFKVIEKNK